MASSMASTDSSETGTGLPSASTKAASTSTSLNGSSGTKHSVGATDSQRSRSRIAWRSEVGASGVDGAGDVASPDSVTAAVLPPSSAVPDGCCPVSEPVESDEPPSSVPSAARTGSVQMDIARRRTGAPNHMRVVRRRPRGADISIIPRFRSGAASRPGIPGPAPATTFRSPMIDNTPERKTEVNVFPGFVGHSGGPGSAPWVLTMSSPAIRATMALRNRARRPCVPLLPDGTAGKKAPYGREHANTPRTPRAPTGMSGDTCPPFS